MKPSEKLIDRWIRRVERTDRDRLRLAYRVRYLRSVRGRSV